MSLFGKLIESFEERKKLKAEISRLQKELSNIVIKYVNKQATIEDLREFSIMMVKYCKLTKYNGHSLDIPDVLFEELNKDTAATYSLNENIVRVNTTYLDGILKSYQMDMTDLIDSIGHEMKHFSQNQALLDYSNLSPEEQSRVDAKSRESIDSLKNYMKLSEYDIKVMHEMFAPYLGEGEIPEGYDSLESFYKDISMATYYTILSEFEARQAGADFTLEFLDVIKKIDSNNEDLEGFVATARDYLTFNKKSRNEDYVKYTEKLTMFSKIYSNDETLLEIVDRIERGDSELKNEASYEHVLFYLLKDKDFNAKKSLLKNAIYNGYSVFADILMLRIVRDAGFQSNKEDISSFIKDCLLAEKNVEFNKEGVEEIYCHDYSDILMQKDFEKTLVRMLKDDPKNATNLVDNSSSNQYSLNFVLKCQEIVFDNEGLNQENSKFFKSLFSAAKESWAEFLRSTELYTELREMLTDIIKTDEDYDLYIDEIERNIDELLV